MCEGSIVFRTRENWETDDDVWRYLYGGIRVGCGGSPNEAHAPESDSGGLECAGIGGQGAPANLEGQDGRSVDLQEPRLSEVSQD